MRRLKRAGIALLAALMIFQVAAMPVMAAGNTAVNYDASATQSQYYRGDVTIQTYRMGWDGLKFENDGGSVEDLAGQVNSSADNPYAYLPTRVNASDFGAFPHAKDGVSALEASEWTVSGASVTDVTPASGVDAVEMTFSAAGESATFSNFSITSDEAKKTLMLALDVDSLSSSGVIEVRVNDTDGDYKVAEINASRSSGEDFITNATGEGIVFQRQLGKMATQTTSGSDGTFNDIQSVEVIAQSGSGTITVTGLNLDKNGKYVLGERKVDTDDDDALETETIYEHKTGGKIEVSGLDTLGSTFDSATLHGLTVDFVRRAASLPSADVNVNFTQAGAYPSFEFKVDLYYRMQLDTGYDLTYSNLELVATQAVPEGRYQTTEIAEGASDTAFADLSFSQINPSWSGTGEEVTLDSTIQPGQTFAIHYQYLITSDEKSAMQQTGGVMGPTGGSGGGIIGFFTSIWGKIVAVLGIGAIGGKWLKG